jgi:hypothetical protein
MMGDDNTKVKWNSANYTQIKAYLPHDVATAFKATCATAEVSMNSVLCEFIVDYCDMRKSSIKVQEPDFTSTNRKRRKKHEELLRLFIQLRDAQEYANDNVHDNFRNSESYEAAEERVDNMDEAIEILENIY